MKLKILTGGLMLAACIAKGQSGVSTQGGTCYWANGSMQWTLGESIVSTLQGPQVALTQGFNQPQFAQSIVTATAFKEEIKVEVFPNPVVEQLTISMDEASDEVLYKLMTMDGRNVLSGEFQSAHFEINFSNYAAGAYMLILRQTNQPLKYFTIIKK